MLLLTAGRGRDVARWGRNVAQRHATAMAGPGAPRLRWWETRGGGEEAKWRSDHRRPCCWLWDKLRGQEWKSALLSLGRRLHHTAPHTAWATAAHKGRECVPESGLLTWTLVCCLCCPAPSPRPPLPQTVNAGRRPQSRWPVPAVPSSPHRRSHSTSCSTPHNGKLAPLQEVAIFALSGQALLLRHQGGVNGP